MNNILQFISTKGIHSRYRVLKVPYILNSGPLVCYQKKLITFFQSQFNMHLSWSVYKLSLGTVPVVLIPKVLNFICIF